MKKVLLTLLAMIVILGALAGAGYTGYRVGYNQGAAASGNVQFFGRSERVNPHVMPIPNFGRDFEFRAQPFRSPMMGRGIFGFTMFAPFRILWNIAVLALIIWIVYWLFTKSGWRITRETNKEQEVPPASMEG